MNLYLIAQDENGDYDSYDSAVVAAESEDDARRIHPSHYKTDWDGAGGDGDWAAADKVAVTLIGVAESSIVRGVICASFNAG